MTSPSPGDFDNPGKPDPEGKNDGPGASGGGGATDLRIKKNDLFHRIIVSGGGGGSDNYYSQTPVKSTDDGTGGAGGGKTAQGYWVSGVYQKSLPHKNLVFLLVMESLLSNLEVSILMEIKHRHKQLMYQALELVGMAVFQAKIQMVAQVAVHRLF